MSLLSRPPHTVMVQLRHKGKDPRGATVYINDGDPIPVRCASQPVSSEDRIAMGIQTDTIRKIIARQWPGNSDSEITWGGFTWDTYGDPQPFTMSPTTAHFEVLILKREAV